MTRIAGSGYSYDGRRWRLLDTVIAIGGLVGFWTAVESVWWVIGRLFNAR